MGWIKKTFWILFFLILISLLVWSFFSIFLPAYYSVQSVCGDITEEELDSMGLMVAGEATPTYENGTLEDIIIVLSGNASIGTIRHEICHAHQFENGIAFSCDHKISKYLTEVHCYFIENFPVYDEEVQEVLAMQNESLPLSLSINLDR